MGATLLRAPYHFCLYRVSTGKPKPHAADFIEVYAKGMTERTRATGELPGIDLGWSMKIAGVQAVGISRPLRIS